MRRRDFVAVVPSSLIGANAPAPLPQFPTLAHQLVWRNWDLVTVTRIARAPGSNTTAVCALARTMALQPQQLYLRFSRRRRFHILRRNRTFVPLDQITVLTGMTRAGITALLAEDVFYSGHLGPSPDLPPRQNAVRIADETELRCSRLACSRSAL